MSNPMFSHRPKVIVNEYKSLDDELSAIAAGLFVQGRQSHDWKIDVGTELLDNIVPNGVEAIKQAFKKWGNHDKHNQ